jgi:hypothetical protein
VPRQSDCSVEASDSLGSTEPFRGRRLGSISAELEAALLLSVVLLHPGSSGKWGGVRGVLCASHTTSGTPVRRWVALAHAGVQMLTAQLRIASAVVRFLSSSDRFAFAPADRPITAPPRL